MNLDTWKLVFKRDESQHPYVPENAAFRSTFTKTSHRSSVFSLEMQRPRITLLRHLFGEHNQLAVPGSLSGNWLKKQDLSTQGVERCG